MKPRPTMTLTEAADALGVHYMTAYRYVRMGDLAAAQVEGTWRVQAAALDAFRTRRAGRSAGGGTRVSTTSARRVAAMANRLVDGDQAGAWQLVEAALGFGSDLAAVYESLLGPALRTIGDQWAAGSITIADEHEASVLAMRIIGRLGALAGRPGRPRGSVVLAAAPGDRHALPSAMLADLLRIDGFRVTDLGADTPVDELARAASRQDRLVAVGICATRALDRRTVALIRRAVEAVHEQARCPVLLGGSSATPAHAAGVGADGCSTDASDAVAWFSSVAGIRPADQPIEESL